MDGSPAPAYRVNELTPDPSVTFDPKVVKDYITYAHRMANRGLVNSSVGGMVIRVAHPNHPDGVCYAKPQGISLEEMNFGAPPKVGGRADRDGKDKAKDKSKDKDAAAPAFRDATLFD